MNAKAIFLMGVVVFLREMPPVIDWNWSDPCEVLWNALSAAAAYWLAVAVVEKE